MDAQLRSQNSFFGKLLSALPKLKNLSNLNILLQRVDGAELELKVAKNKF